MAKVTIGSLIDHYQILEEIGKGGMGVVYKALNVNLDKFVAIKTIALGLASEDNFTIRFRTEARALARLENPHIVRIYDMRADDNQWFIVMEYVEGITLAEKIRRDKIIPWPAALSLFEQMLTAIGHAHRLGVIHRDIKPNNIMITPDGIVKITDFGLAKDQYTRGHTQAVSTGGTLYYMSPEQVKGLLYTDHRSDIYSLGITLYEMLAGKIPFRKDDTDFTIREAIVKRQFPPPSHFNPQLPAVLDILVMKLIAKEPEDRYQNVDELQQYLVQFSSGALLPKQDVAVSGDHPVSLLNDSFFSSDLAGVLPSKLTSRIQEKRPVLLLFRTRKFLYALAASILLLMIGTFIYFKIYSPNAKFITNLSLLTEPSSASIFGNGKPIGKSPVYLDSLAGDKIFISIKKDDYFPIDTLLTLSTVGKNDFLFTMRPLGRMAISVYPEDALLRVDNQPVTATEALNLILTAGRHEIRIEHPDYEPILDSTITIAGKNPELNYTLIPRSKQPDWGSLQVTSEPPDATIYLNETYIGTTPLLREKINAGTYKLVIHKNDYAPYLKNVNITGRKMTRIHSPLVISIGSMEITSLPPGAEIWIDAAQIKESRTPWLVDSLGVGKHQLVLKKPGYQEYSSEISIEADRRQMVSAELFTQTGMLSIQVSPWGTIFIDDILKKENTNIKYNENLPAGRHQVRVAHPTLGTLDKTVEIEADRNEEILIDFNTIVSIRITAFDPQGRPVWADIIIDDKNTGELTPKEIGVRVGQHTFAAQKEGYVLVNGEKEIMIENPLQEPLKFILKKIM